MIPNIRENIIVKAHIRVLSKGLNTWFAMADMRSMGLVRISQLLYLRYLPR